MDLLSAIRHVPRPDATPLPGPHAGLRSGAKFSARMALGMTVTRLGAMHARSTVFSLAVCDTQITCRRHAGLSAWLCATGTMTVDVLSL